MSYSVCLPGEDVEDTAMLVISISDLWNHLSKAVLKEKGWE